MLQADAFDLFYLMCVQLIQIPVNAVNADVYAFVFGQIIYCFEFTYLVHQPGDEQMLE